MQGDLTVRLAEQSAAALPPIIWNEAEVSAALDEMLSAYKGRQYHAGIRATYDTGRRAAAGFGRGGNPGNHGRRNDRCIIFCSICTAGGG